MHSNFMSDLGYKKQLLPTGQELRSIKTNYPGIQQHSEVKLG